MQKEGFATKDHLDRDPAQYLDLWKWFSDDAAKIKDKMWTMAAYFYTLLGALLSFAANKLSSGETGAGFIQVEEQALVGTVVAIGCLLSGYAMFMIREYGRHLRNGWNRANYLRFRIEGLSEVWCYGESNMIAEDEKLKQATTNNLPPVAQRLIWLLGLFGVTFVVLLVLVLVQ